MARLPHMIRQKVSTSSTSEDHIDKEFNKLEATFNSQSNATNRLQQDLQKYKNAFYSFFENQRGLSKAFASFLKSSNNGNSFATTSINIHDNKDGNGNESGNDGNFNGHEAIVKCINETIDHKMLPIIGELKEMQQIVNGKIIKRNHKLLDYNRFHHDLVKSQQNDRSSMKIIQLERELMEATDAYDAINGLLKEELYEFSEYTDQLLLSLTEEFVRMQRIVFKMISNAFSINSIPKDYIEIMNGFQERHESNASILATIGIYNNGSNNSSRSKLSLGSINSSLSKRSPSSPSEVPMQRTLSHGKEEIHNRNNERSNEMTNQMTLEFKNTMIINEKKERENEIKKRDGGRNTSLSNIKKSFSLSQSESTLLIPPQLPKKRMIVTAIYDFDGQEEGDLAFKKGDKIEIIENNDNPNSWWRGRINSKIGNFPGNYVS